MMIPAIIPKIPVQRRVLPNFLSTFFTSKLMIVLEIPVKRAQKAKIKGIKVTVPEKSQIDKRTVITPVKRSQPLFSSAEKYLMISEIPLTKKMRANKKAKDRRRRAGLAIR